jgi:hypothetical protein
MKKLLVIIILFLATKGYSQTFKYNGVSNPVVDVAIFKGTDAYGIENALTVPEGTFVTFAEHANGYWRWAYPDESSNHQISAAETTLPEGFKFYSTYNSDGARVTVYVHEYASSGSTFSYSEAELNSSVKLFPNPTTSEVALNSEKTYEIEVFDILGNKVMELVGNSINMEHLSNATYIVNALDVESRESLSYKVIKK